MTYCPDCEREFHQDEFISHREMEHPPTTMAIAVDGIKTKAALGYDPPDPED